MIKRILAAGIALVAASALGLLLGQLPGAASEQADAPGAPRLAVGAAAWRWQDLLSVRRIRN